MPDNDAKESPLGILSIVNFVFLAICDATARINSGKDSLDKCL